MTLRPRGLETYSLDSDVLMTAAREYYAFDLVPAFWNSLIDQAKLRRVLSIDRVKREIEQGKGELAAWANKHFHQFFESTASEDVLESFSHVMNWVQGERRFKDSEKARFAEGADGWLIAHAMVGGHTIVTLERPQPKSMKVKIPDAAAQFSVTCVPTYEMLRKLGIRFSS